MWLRAGHEVRQESKTAVMDLLGRLAEPGSSVPMDSIDTGPEPKRKKKKKKGKKGEENDPRKIGKVLAGFEGVKVKYQLSENDWYFRATVHSSKNHPNPSFKGQMEKAWTQPVWTSSN